MRAHRRDQEWVGSTYDVVEVGIVQVQLGAVQGALDTGVRVELGESRGPENDAASARLVSRQPLLLENDDTHARPGETPRRAAACGSGADDDDIGALDCTPAQVSPP
jgi:hypothetical protein